MNKKSKIYIAGHQGMVGSLIKEKLISLGYFNLVFAERSALDLRDQQATITFIKEIKPEYVFLIAGRVGGIQANIDSPGSFLYDNLMICANVIEGSRISGVKKLIFMGSSCIYPRLSPQPMREDYLLSGSLEPTNEGYAIGKIAGLKLCEYYQKEYNTNFISAMPSNLYGPKDSFSLKHSHVLSALIRKIHNAKTKNQDSLTLWGTGEARREFLYNEDCVEALIFLMHNYNSAEHINVGSGVDYSIQELAGIIKTIVGFEGEFQWDTTKPNGMPQKLMDNTKINHLGWESKTSIEGGISRTYQWFLRHVQERES